MILVSCQGGIAAITIDSVTLCIVHRSRLKGVMRIWKGAAAYGNVGMQGQVKVERQLSHH